MSLGGATSKLLEILDFSSPKVQLLPEVFQQKIFHLINKYDRYFMVGRV